MAIPDVRQTGDPPSDMKQAIHTIQIATKGQAFYDITRQVRDWTATQDIDTGLLTLWCQHTSASLTVQENADPDVRADLLDFFRRLAPEANHYRHRTEGPDDMPAHIKAAITQTSLSIPVQQGTPTLGTWQAIYLLEHRTEPQIRRLVVHFIGS